MAVTLAPGLERRLKAELTGDVRFDRFTRGRYATDASHYQMMPLGVVAPRTMAEAERAIAIARAEKVTVLARGGGTSQSGQTINHSMVIDCSKYLNRILDLDIAGRRCVVEPGIVLDDLNRQLKRHGLWFPVDISTASRATLGGMAGNNSCGARSLRYGVTRDNVLSIDAVLADGSAAHFGPVGAGLRDPAPDPKLRPLAEDLLAIGLRESDEIAARFPKVQRRVGGYNLDALAPNALVHNLAHILVGSEGTLGFSTKIELKLWPLLGRRAVGACHFARFYDAMAAAQHIVKLKPIAVELVDRTMIELARGIEMFRPTVDAFVRGAPDAVLLVEFAEEDWDENIRRLRQLEALMGDLGFAWGNSGAKWGGVAEVLDPKLQGAITEVRTAGLNIMMSMKEEGKPVSFVEDCAVPLEHLAEYTSRLSAVFAKHGTRGTWYAHASVGCLHVRPVLNLRLDKDKQAMREIAEEAFAMVAEYKGSHSGEHGDGLVRSEFHAPMFGERLVHAFEEVKDRFDPGGLFNPGKIVRAPKFDDRANFRYGPGYHGEPMTAALDWSAYPGVGGGFQGAVEMCNNNGACRALAGGVMCPSYRATRDEKDVTRGRANTLRLAISGQLGPGALASDEMAETMKLCVSCKACRRECPTGVDMARMKIEVLAARAAKLGLTLHSRLVAFLPRYAPVAARLAWLFNLRDVIPGAAALSESIADFSARRTLPRWRTDWFRDFRELPRRRGRERNPRGRAPCRYLQPLFRAGKSPRGRHGPARRRLSRKRRDADRRNLAAAVLRPHLPRRRPGRRGPARGRALPCRARALCRPRGADHRPGAELPILVPRRNPRHRQGRPGRRGRQPGGPARGVPGPRGRRRPARIAAGADRRPGHAPWPLPSEIVRRHGRRQDRARTGSRAVRGDHRVRAAAAWPAASAIMPRPSTCRSPWASCRCCRRCAMRLPTPSSSPTARPAATRSRTAPAGRRSMSRKCSPGVSRRASLRRGRIAHLVATRSSSVIRLAARTQTGTMAASNPKPLVQSRKLR